MNVRGSSLSHPKVVETLRPFIVAFWGQANDEPVPADIRPLYEASGYGGGRRDPAGGSNVRCFVLDAGGRLLHAFNGFPDNAPNPTAYSPDQYASYFVGEIAYGAARLSLPKVDTTLKLPDVKDGVRLFIRLPQHRGSYAAPVVEVVENESEWKELAYPKTPREIDASKLSRWLRLCYPPGVNEHLEPFQIVKGTLTLKPAGENQAVLSGPIELAMSGRSDHPFAGSLEAVLRYQSSGVALRGVVDGVYPRFDPPRGRWIDWPLTTAIESRPN